MITVDSAVLSDVGQKRKRNEDSYYLDDKLGIYVVADGMGGHQAGDVASRILVDTIRDYMERFKKGNQVEEMEQVNDKVSKEANRLLSAISLANRAIYRLAEGKDTYQGMGSTVSAVLLAKNTLIAANVGDSPIFLIRNGDIDELSRPHTLMAEQKNLFPDGGMQLGKNLRHVLTKAMGVEKEVAADICEIQPFSNDVVVICSDGLTDKVSKEEIQHIVEHHFPSKACEILVNLANERGGDDNITVIIILIKNVKDRSEGFLGRLFGLFR